MHEKLALQNDLMVPYDYANILVTQIAFHPWTFLCYLVIRGIITDITNVHIPHNLRRKTIAHRKRWHYGTGKQEQGK